MPEISYVDCRITIHDDEFASYEDEYKRSVPESAPEEDRRIPQDELARLTIERIQHWIERSDQCEREDLILLGRHLYGLLFHGKIGEEFRRSYELFNTQRKTDPNLRLRITLVFHKQAEKLAAYPWEFLYLQLQETGLFLAGQATNLILTRFVPETPLVEGLRKEEEEPLRILVAYSSPVDDTLGAIEASEVIEAIRSLTSPQIEVELVENYKKEELKDKITEFKPHVFHFIGHGDAGRIALVADDDELEKRQLSGNKTETRWCDSQTTNDLFADHKPSLVFLHACKGATTFETTLRSFTSTARELVYWEIPAVIGMQFAIENAAAATFAKCFYRELANGNPIDEAVSIGRRELGSTSSRGAWADPRFGTPLVYLQAHRAIIAPPAAQGNGVVIESTERPDRMVYDCPKESCSMKIKPGFRSCPKCATKIVKCVNDHPVGADWMTCPYCETPLQPSISKSSRKVESRSRQTGEREIIRD